MGGDGPDDLADDDVGGDGHGNEGEDAARDERECAGCEEESPGQVAEHDPQCRVAQVGAEIGRLRQNDGKVGAEDDDRTEKRQCQGQCVALEALIALGLCGTDGACRPLPRLLGRHGHVGVLCSGFRRGGRGRSAHRSCG